jgi:hypothetical protein
LTPAPTLATVRRCPYCGSSIELGACPIVATNFENFEFLTAEDFDLDEIKLPSKTVPLRFLPKTNWPVVAEPPRERPPEPVSERPRRSKLEEAFGSVTATVSLDEVELPPLIGHGAFREDVPARACSECEFPLPQSIDLRPALVVAVVGVNRVGKTHLLAASLTEAYRRRGLATIGCSEFVPDDSTSRRFLEDYFVPLFRHGQVLDATPPEDQEVRFRPLVFDVTLPDTPPFALVMHDIAGEVLGDHRKREQLATYLRGARGIIFVVDPRDIDDLRDGLPDWILESNELGSWDQGALLAACVKPGGILDGRAPPPVAVTIAKSDLLPMACSESFGFLSPAPTPETRAEFDARIHRSSQEVEEFLERHGAHNILGPAREHNQRLRASGNSRVTYHAVSALGSAPDIDEQLTDKVRPINCLDPLAVILAQIMM